jgi:hypothetical protein
MLLGDRSALFYLVTGRFPPVVTLARGGWSALFHLVIAATCLVPAVIVVQGGSLPHCVWQALRLCKRRMASLLVLYGGYWLVGHAVQWLSSLHSDLPTFGYGDGPAGFWGPVGPLQWAWVILFGVIGWQVIHLWLSATFMALVLEEPGEEQGE